jgi:hypothetical protein
MERILEEMKQKKGRDSMAKRTSKTEKPMINAF